MDRDEGVCQLCMRPGDDIHHVVPAGMGRKKVNTLANLITLCRDCHRQAHSTKKMREACEEWARIRYGPKVEELKRLKWEG